MEWRLCCRVLQKVRKVVAASCALYSSQIIVKSLQLRRRRQIAKPRKYCLVRVFVFFFFFFFFSVCFLYFFIFIFCFSQVGNSVKFPTTSIRA